MGIIPKECEDGAAVGVYALLDSVQLLATESQTSASFCLKEKGRGFNSEVYFSMFLPPFVFCVEVYRSVDDTFTSPSTTNEPLHFIDPVFLQ